MCPVVKKKIFPKTTFRLEPNKEFPFQQLGYETVEFKNGDKLLIEHVGCENYTFIFRFETKRFTGKPEDAGFWYKAAAELMSDVAKGIDDTFLVPKGIKELKAYPKTHKQPEFEEFLEFCPGEIKCGVSVDGVKKLENGRFEVTVSVGMGPL